MQPGKHVVPRHWCRDQQRCQAQCRLEARALLMKKLQQFSVVSISPATFTSALTALQKLSLSSCKGLADPGHGLPQFNSFTSMWPLPWACRTCGSATARRRYQSMVYEMRTGVQRSGM